MATKRKIISIHEKKKSGISWGKFFYWIVLLAFLGVMAYALFFAGFLSINQTDISGFKELDREAVAEVVNSHISGKYLGFLEKNNLLLVRSGFLKKDLKNRFKKIESADVRKKFPNALLVSIKEKESALIFCHGDDCFVIDKNGTAYSEKDYSWPEIRENRLITLRDFGEKSIKLGDEILSPGYLNYILNIENKIRDNLNVEMAKEYETPSRVSDDIRGITAEGWKIFFNQNVDLQKEINMLRIVLDEKVGNEKRKDLEYVDLRSDNKVYYKFKEGTEEEVNKDESSQSAEEKKVEDKKGKKKKN